MTSDEEFSIQEMIDSSDIVKNLQERVKELEFIVAKHIVSTEIKIESLLQIVNGEI